MGRQLRDPRTGRAGEQTVARRRLALLEHELGSGGAPPRGQSASTGASADAHDAATSRPELANLAADDTTDRATDAAGTVYTAGAAYPPGARHRAAALPAPARLAAAALDQLPPRGAGADRRITAQHVTVVALLVAALVCGGSWWVLSGRPEQRAVAPVEQAAPDPAVPAPAGADPFDTSAEPDGAIAGEAGAPVPPPATQSAGTATPVVVDVAGKVRRPGLVTLPLGARVADALKSAGGVRPSVELTALNLARPLVDGEQILVGVQAVPAPAGSVPAPVPSAVPTPGTAAIPPGTPATLVNLNTATLEQLDTLPGVGPVTGQAILDWRSANGAFSTVDELIEVDGIGDATLADLRDLVTV